MGKDIGRIYKYSQSQLSTSSLKSPVSSSSYPQSSSDIELTRNSVPSVREKNKINSILYYQNITQNDASITNNDDIQSYETARFFFIIPIISTTNHDTQLVAITSSSILNLNTPMILPLLGK